VSLHLILHSADTLGHFSGAWTGHQGQMTNEIKILDMECGGPIRNVTLVSGFKRVDTLKLADAQMKQVAQYVVVRIGSDFQGSCSPGLEDALHLIRVSTPCQTA
jgi:hypothetical protein